MKIHIYGFILTLVLLNFCEGNDSLKELKKCKYGDHKCMEEYTTFLINNYPKGINEVGFPSVDPLQVNYETVFERDDANPISLILKVSNPKIDGIKNGKVYKISGFAKDPNGSYEIRAKFPYLSFGGPYKAQGQFLVIPISGFGTSNITFVETNAQIKFTGEGVQRDGNTYLNIKNYTYTFKTKKCIFEADNIINGNKLLSETTMELLNDNWESLIEDYRPSISRTHGRIWKELISEVFDKIPYADLFAE